MPAKNIFLSYRRGTDGNAARMLYDLLAAEFGANRVFFDIDTIPIGVDFHEHLEDQVGKCGAFIALIGPSWTQAIPRLASPDDFVRIEIEAALERRHVPLIPVLVDGARMPSAEDLPAELAALPRRNGIDLPQQYLPMIVREKLVPSLRQVLDVTSETPTPAAPAKSEQPRKWLFPAIAAIPILGILGLSLYSQRDILWGGDANDLATSDADSIRTGDTVTVQPGVIQPTLARADPGSSGVFDVTAASAIQTACKTGKPPASDMLTTIKLSGGAVMREIVKALRADGMDYSTPCWWQMDSLFAAFEEDFPTNAADNAPDQEMQRRFKAVDTFQQKASAVTRKEDVTFLYQAAMQGLAPEYNLASNMLTYMEPSIVMEQLLADFPNLPIDNLKKVDIWKSVAYVIGFRMDEQGTFSPYRQRLMALKPGTTAGAACKAGTLSADMRRDCLIDSVMASIDAN